MERRKCFVIFNKPIVVPDNNMEKLKIYGFLIDVDVEPTIVTYKNICRYVEKYVLPIVEIFEDGFDDSNGWVFTKGDKRISYGDTMWMEYMQRSKSKNTMFYITDAENVPYTQDSLSDSYNCWIISEELVNEINRKLMNQE